MRFRSGLVEHYTDGNFYFAFQQRTRGSVTAHAHTGLELHYCYDGDGFFRAPGSEKPLVPGRVTLVHAPVFHRVHAHSRRDYTRTVLHLPENVVAKAAACVEVDGGVLLPSKKNPIIQAVPSSRDHEDLTRVFKQVRRVLRLDHDPYSPLITLYLAELLYIVHRMSTSYHDVSRQVSPQDNYLVEKARRIIDNHPSFDLTVDEIAEQVGVSRGHLCHVFNNVLGVSPRIYLVERRMELAKTLLAAGLSVSEVAAECDYADPSSFSRSFKTYVGVSPTDYTQNAHQFTD